MPDCSKCGKPVSGAVCPACKTPVPTASMAKEAADAEFDIYEGFTPEEVTIFNQYLRLVQSGWLEVAAVDRLGTDHNKELEEIKSIIKRGLKALQKAQERALKEAELRARQLAKDEKKNARLAAKQAKKDARKQQKAQPTRPGRPSGQNKSLKKIPIWGWALALAFIVFLAIFLWWPEDEAPPELTPATPPQPVVIEKHILRQGRVVCYQQADLEKITREANNRKQFEEMLLSGRCFITSRYFEVKEISPISNSMRKARVDGLGWIFFHQEALEKQIISQPAQP